VYAIFLEFVTVFCNTSKWHKQMCCKKQSTTPWKWCRQTSQRDRVKKRFAYKKKGVH